MRVDPLEDRVIVSEIKDEGEKRFGEHIIIPDIKKEQPNMGEVRAVGPGRVLDDGSHKPIAVAVGDVVLYGKYAGNQVTVRDEEILVLREPDIIGIVREDEG